MTNGLKLCKQCRRERPNDEFFPVRRPWRVDFCNACVRENMRRYRKYVEMDPDKVRRRGVDT